MQNYGTRGLALLLTLVATAFYAYCCFLGLNFLLDGKVIVSALCVLAALAVLGYALKSMVRNKIRRNAREGRRKEVQAFCVLALVFVFSCPLFSKFMEVNDYARHGMLAKDVNETIDTVKVIDSCYIAYANKRIKKMRRISKIYGISLSRRLKPDNLDSIAKERREWLDKLSTPNIWNIYTATNIHQLTSAGETWTKEYANMSAIIYKGEGEDTKAFEHNSSKDKIDAFQHIVNEMHSPDWRSVLATLLCFLIMMTNYFVTRRVKTGTGK